MKISLADLSALSLGGAILATGGGGDPYIGRLALKRQIEKTAPPSLIATDDLADDAFVVTVGLTGSPSVILEKLLSESFADSALRRLERLVGRRADAILPIEVGGINSLIPLMAGCATNLPVIDADGMGRAFPTLDRTTFGIAGISAFPVVTLNERLETVIVEASNHERGERTARAALVQMGASGTCALYPMTGRQVKDTAIKGTMSLALAIGRAVEAARAEKSDPFEAILETLRGAERPIFGRVLFQGKVADIARNTVGGYNIGSGLLEAVSDEADTASFAFQNEFLFLRRNGTLLAVVPDSICFLDSETAEPTMCESMRYGQRVTAMGFAAAPQFRTPAGLAVTGPASFGLSERYTGIETLSEVAGGDGRDAP